MSWPKCPMPIMTFGYQPDDGLIEHEALFVEPCGEELYRKIVSLVDLPDDDDGYESTGWQIECARGHVLFMPEQEEAFDQEVAMVVGMLVARAVTGAIGSQGSAFLFPRPKSASPGVASEAAAQAEHELF